MEDKKLGSTFNDEDILKSAGSRDAAFNRVSIYLNILTGQNYVLAQSSQRKWGKDGPIEEGIFFQIMPEYDDDGFFDWYCEHREYQQFFTTVDRAVLHFLLFRSKWKK